MTLEEKEAAIRAYSGKRRTTEQKLQEADWLDNGDMSTPRHLRAATKSVTDSSPRPADTVAVHGRVERRASDMCDVHGESAYDKPNSVLKGAPISTRMTRKPKE